MITTKATTLPTKENLDLSFFMTGFVFFFLLATSIVLLSVQLFLVQDKLAPQLFVVAINGVSVLMSTYMSYMCLQRVIKIKSALQKNEG